MKQVDRIGRINDNIRFLRKEADKLTSLTVGSDEYYNVVVLGFLNRMSSQIGTVQEIPFRKDALLIARSVLEGYVILNWLSRNVRERRRRVQRYREIHRLNLLVRYDQIIEGMKAGTVEQRKEKRRLKKVRTAFVGQIVTECTHVLSVKDIEAIRAGKALPHKEFLERLIGKRTSIRKLFRLAQKQKGTISGEAYRRGYGPLAQYHHWAPISLDVEWDPESRTTSHTPEDESAYFRALDLCYISFSETIKIVARAFRKDEIAVAVGAIDHSHRLLSSREQLPDTPEGQNRWYF